MRKKKKIQEIQVRFDIPDPSFDDKLVQGITETIVNEQIVSKKPITLKQALDILDKCKERMSEIAFIYYED